MENISGFFDALTNLIKSERVVDDFFDNLNVSEYLIKIQNKLLSLPSENSRKYSFLIAHHFYNKRNILIESAILKLHEEQADIYHKCILIFYNNLCATFNMFGVDFKSDYNLFASDVELLEFASDENIKLWSVLKAKDNLEISQAALSQGMLTIGRNDLLASTKNQFTLARKIDVIMAMLNALGVKLGSTQNLHFQWFIYFLVSKGSKDDKIINTSIKTAFDEWNKGVRDLERRKSDARFVSEFLINVGLNQIAKDILQKAE